MPGETFGVDGGRSDDELEVGPARHQALQVAEQEIDVEAALVRLVDDDRVVLRQPPVGLDLRQQDAVGHELDVAVLADLLGEAHLVTDRSAQRRVQFLGHAPRHRPGGDAARLGAADQAGPATAGGQAELGQLGGLARTGLAGHHDHLVPADQLDDAPGLARNRQAVVEFRYRRPGIAGRAGLARGLQGLQIGLQALGRITGGQGLGAQPDQAAAVTAQHALARNRRNLRGRGLVPGHERAILAMRP